MITRRKEPFRYSMEEPLECQMELTAINQMAVDGKLATIELIDISKNGCKIRSPLNLHASENTIECRIHLRLNVEAFVFPGEVRWQRDWDGVNHYYGIQLLLNDVEKEKISIELRSLAAERKIKVM
ncbi:PilZ domain-containing protein [Paenibacillus pinistramenti]|uniref:PilZ domain-containing protein n=1 Tax=Paenibacillus pinistramenti TaxID=1768003 RepID=UPI001108113A|nr:PilZ domain-containing protein [Paenibacillus pinistramenti]